MKLKRLFTIFLTVTLLLFAVGCTKTSDSDPLSEISKVTEDTTQNGENAVTTTEASPTSAPISTTAADPTLAPTSMTAADPTLAPTSMTAADPTLAPTSTTAADPTLAPTSTTATDPTLAPTSTTALTAAVSAINTSYTTDSGLTISADAVISLNNTAVSIEGSGASANGQTVTITSAGTYLISGSLTDGQIIVNTTDEKKVKLILAGVDIYCSDSSPVYIISSPKKTEITLLEGTVNKLEDGSSYTLSTATDADNPSAVIYSKDDLEIEGDGTLYITANYCKGIFSKDDLVINSGTIHITAVDDGIRGKDSVTIKGGTITIEADGDGLRTSNEEDSSKGYILISGGTLSITAELDAIQAITDLTVTGGKITISSGGGSANSSSSSKENSWGNWGGGFGGRGGQGSTTTTTTETDSAKGLKAGNTITVSGGTFVIDSSDDSIHSNNTVNINGGAFTITSGDDGVHADDTLNITNGTINITKSYEGIESVHINISGGTVRITASDDGINAAGGTDSSATTNRTTGRGMGMFSETTGDATFSGGYVIVNAAGDGIDVNGSATMTGGYYVVYGPTDNGNGALDYDGTFTINGGTLIALGSTGMAQSVTSSTQGVLSFSISLSSGTLLNISDSNGNGILTIESAKSAGCAVICSPLLTTGNSYTVSTGGSYSVTGTDGIYTGGTYSGGTSRGTVAAK